MPCGTPRHAVVVSLAVSDSHAEVVVGNHGPAIAAADRQMCTLEMEGHRWAAANVVAARQVLEAPDARYATGHDASGAA